jgi:hypothetical protein
MSLPHSSALTRHTVDDVTNSNNTLRNPPTLTSFQRFIVKQISINKDHQRSFSWTRFDELGDNFRSRRQTTMRWQTPNTLRTPPTTPTIHSPSNSTYLDFNKFILKKMIIRFIIRFILKMTRTIKYRFDEFWPTAPPRRHTMMRWQTQQYIELHLH